MNIIYKLTVQYMKKNRRRTKVAIAGIVCMMVVLTAVLVFSEGFLSVLRSRVAEEDGAYHFIFHELSEEQCEELKKWKEVKSCVTDVACTEHGGEGKICARVEVKKISRRMLNKAQNMAETLGMRKLPEEERWEMSNRKQAEYNVTEHTELLTYYGITHSDKMGTGKLITITLVLLALIGSVFIYNAYAISVFEKLKYLGTLGSAGASGFQKSMVVYWEGLLEGVIGIPVGILLGILLSKLSLYGLGKYFLFEGGLSADVTVGMILKLTGAGILMIMLACYTPAVTAANTTGMELISGQYTLDESMRRRTSLLKKHRILGLCGTLALKNILARKKNYIFNGMILVLTFCLLLDGLTAMRAYNGEYEFKDERKRPQLQLWVELYTEDMDKIQSFYEHVAALEEIKTVSLERRLELEGALLEEEQVEGELKDHRLASNYGYMGIANEIQDVSTGEIYSGYWIRPEIVGVDEKTFRTYMEEMGGQMPENGKYPVLIEDYVRIQVGEEFRMGRFLKTKQGERFPFLYSRYGDMGAYALFPGATEEAKVDEILKGEFYVAGITEKASPLPYFSGDYENIDGWQALNIGKHRFYMVMEDFEKLIKDSLYEDTYGKHPEDSVVDYTYIDKKIPTYIKFDIYRKSGDKIKEDKEMENQIEKIAADVGMSGEDYRFQSAAIWQREKYFNSQEFLKLVLGYGVVLFIAAISLTNIFQNISVSMRVRKREFSVYQSMGMTADVLRRMIMIENTAYGVIGCALGIPISLAFLNDVWREFGNYQEIIPEIPWDLIGAEFLLAIILVVVPIIHTKAQLRHLNIMETVRDENV